MEVHIIRPETNGIILRLPNVIDFEVSYDHVYLEDHEYVPRRAGLISFTVDLTHLPIMDLQQAIGMYSHAYRTLVLSHGDHQHAFDRCLCVIVNYHHSGNNVNYTGSFQWRFRGSAFTFDEAVGVDYGEVNIEVATRRRRITWRDPLQELDWRRFGF